MAVGKVVVITGAGIGLGRAIARRLAADGDTVVLLGRTFSKVQAAAEEIGGSAFAVECDVSSADSVRMAFATIAARHPTIDVLVNNAAIYEPFTIAEATDEQILGIVGTNFSGPILCARAAIPMMEKGAHIINVSSESVKLIFPMLSLYQSTKAGLERFSESLSIELAPAGIRVSTVRAGTMSEEGKEPPAWDMAVTMRFVEECQRAGLDVMARPMSHFRSVADLFRTLIDLPPDLRINHVSLEGRHP